MRGHSERRLPAWLIGLVLIVVIAVGSVLAYTKELPWSDPYTIKATFSSAQSVRPSSPVRIAGVNVGTVSEVEHLTSAETEELRAQTGDPDASAADTGLAEEAAVVTIELDEDARPIREDATFKLRPRLFLEGNYFIDMQPGSPNADEVSDGFTFPVNQTAYSVQLDTVLTTLQGDVRSNLKVFLNQFGNALVKHGGAEGFRELYRTSGPAGKFTSQVNEAFLGTHPGDLSGLIKGLDRVVRGLGQNEITLQNLVTNFRTFAGSFAAQDVALGRAVEQLPGVLRAAQPAFANLNESFPALRAFAREALPGVRATPATLDEATPLIRQVRKLVSKRELRGLVSELRPAIPSLAKLADGSLDFLEEARQISSCFNEVVIPWSQDTVQPLDDAYPHDPVGRVFEETAYGLSGIASESRSGDANGQYIRVAAGGGTNTVKIPAFGGGGVGFPTDSTVGVVPFDIVGAMPRIQDSGKTPFRPDVRCETQEPPNLQAGTAAVPFDENSGDAPLTDALELLSDLSPNQIRDAANLPREVARGLAETVKESR